MQQCLCMKQTTFDRKITKTGIMKREKLLLNGKHVFALFTHHFPSALAEVSTRPLKILIILELSKT